MFPGISRAAEEPEARAHLDARLPELVLEHVPVAVVAVDASDDLVLTNPASRDLGVVHDGRLATEVRHVVRRARREEAPVCEEVAAAAGPLRVRAVAAGGGAVVVVAEDMREAHRVEAVRRDFAANLGHELKTPVGAIGLLAEAAASARDDPAVVQRFVARIGEEARRLSDLIQALIELSRVQATGGDVGRAEAALDDVMDEAVARVRAAAEVRSTSIVRAGGQGIRVAGDHGQLVTAVANLLDNAIAYSAPGDPVTVTAHESAEAVEVAVTDRGVGIPAQDIDRIFERFYRVDPARSRVTGGNGLGLAIVKHIVANHGGDIRVWSTVGAGSTFTIRLPPR